MAAQESNFYHRLKNRLNPLKPGIDKGEKYSRILILGLSVLAILNLYDFFWTLWDYLKADYTLDWPYWVHLISLLVLPGILYLFALRRSIGWILIGAFLFFMLFSFSYDFLITILYGTSDDPQSLDVNMAATINYRLLFYMLLSVGSLILLFNKAVKSLYTIKASQAFGVLLFGIVLIGLLVFTLFV